MRGALARAVDHADARVRLARDRAAARAGPHLVGRQDRVGLVAAGGAVSLTDESAAAIRTAKVLRAVHEAVYYTDRLVFHTYGSLAARAARYFVQSHRLVRPA